MSDPAVVEFPQPEYTPPEPRYQLFVDALAVTTGELGAILNGLAFVVNQAVLDNLPGSIKKFFVQVQ